MGRNVTPVAELAANHILGLHLSEDGSNTWASAISQPEQTLMTDVLNELAACLGTKLALIDDWSGGRIVNGRSRSLKRRRTG